MRSAIAGCMLALVAVAAAQSQAAEHLTTAVAEYREVPREYVLDGTVEAAQQTTVSAQIQGQITEILFDVDDFVQKGEIIIRLKDKEQLARLSRAQAELEEARARLKEAQDSHERTQEIFSRKLVSQSELDRAVAELKAARARLDAANAGLQQAQEQYEYTRVLAPYSGIVTQRFVQVGEVAQPGQPLMSGLSLERLRVNVDVPQTLIPLIRDFSQARVYLTQGEQPAIETERITVFPFADPNSNTFQVRLELPEDVQGLFPGMFVKTVFATGTQRLLVVPASAVVYRSEVTGVYVVSAKGTVSFRHIRAGKPTTDTHVSVLSGLDAGEAIALDPIEAGLELRRQRERVDDD